MKYSLLEFKQDLRIGATRAVRDFFAPIIGLVRWLAKSANEAADRNIREAHVMSKRD